MLQVVVGCVVLVESNTAKLLLKLTRMNQVATTPHKGIAQRLPEATQSPPGKPNTGQVIALPVLNGLHHDYRLAA